MDTPEPTPLCTPSQAKIEQYARFSLCAGKPPAVRTETRLRGVDPAVLSSFKNHDQERRSAVTKTESLRSGINAISEAIGKAKRSGEDLISTEEESVKAAINILVKDGDVPEYTHVRPDGSVPHEIPKVISLEVASGVVRKAKTIILPELEVRSDFLTRELAGDLILPPQPSQRRRPRRHLRARQRRPEDLGHDPHLRLPRQAPLGNRRSPRHPRLRARRQDLRRPLRPPARFRRPPRASPRQLHARPPHPRARLRRSPTALASSTPSPSSAPASSPSSPKTSSTQTTKARTFPASCRTATTGSSPPPKSPSPTSSATKPSTSAPAASTSPPTPPATVPRLARTARTPAA